MRSPGALLFALLVAIGAGACGGSRGHALQTGAYAFTELEVLEDACGLLPADGLWDGTMVRAGDYVNIDYGLGGIALAGYYRYAQEAFYVDGTAEVFTLTLGSGQVCEVDQVQIHLDAITLSPTQFEGAITVRTFHDGLDACVCELSATYQADRQ